MRHRASFPCCSRRRRASRQAGRATTEARQACCCCASGKRAIAREPHREARRWRIPGRKVRTACSGGSGSRSRPRCFSLWTGAAQPNERSSAWDAVPPGSADRTPPEGLAHRSAARSVRSRHRGYAQLQSRSSLQLGPHALPTRLTPPPRQVKRDGRAYAERITHLAGAADRASSAKPSSSPSGGRRAAAPVSSQTARRADPDAREASVRSVWDDPTVSWELGDGVVQLPDGTRLRGWGLAQAHWPVPDPEWALCLLADRPEEMPCSSRWVRWPDFRLPADRRVARVAFAEAHASRDEAFAFRSCARAGSDGPAPRWPASRSSPPSAAEKPCRGSAPTTTRVRSRPPGSASTFATSGVAHDHPPDFSQAPEAGTRIHRGARVRTRGSSDTKAKVRRHRLPVWPGDIRERLSWWPRVRSAAGSNDSV
jgi:hypothetical protein